MVEDFAMGVQGSVNKRSGEQEPWTRAYEQMARIRRIVWRVSCAQGESIICGQLQWGRGGMQWT